MALATVSVLRSRAVLSSQQIARATAVLEDDSPLEPRRSTGDSRPPSAAVPPPAKEPLTTKPPLAESPDAAEPTTPKRTTVQKPVTAGDAQPAPNGRGHVFPLPAAGHAAVDRFADIDRVSHDEPPRSPRRLGALDLPAEFQSHLRLDAPPREPIRPVDVEARLQLPVNGMKFDAGLGDFLQLVSQMSAVPITVRPLGLRNGRLTLDSPVRLDGNDATVAELLASALRPLRLGFAIENGHAVVDRLENLSGELWLRKHNVRDLMESGMSAKALSRAVRMLVDPHAWGPGESDARFFLKDAHLVLRDTEAAHFEALMLLNKFRTARGLSLTGPLAREQVTFGWRSLPKIMKQPVSIRAQAKTTFGEVVSQLNSTVQPTFHVMADWEALAPLGWDFGSVLEFAPQDMQLGKLLDDLCATCQIDYCVPALGIIQLTSHEAAEQTFEIDLHPIDDLAVSEVQAEQMIDQLQSVIGVRHFVEGGGEGAILYDAGTQSLVVRLPQAKQAAVNWLLQQLRQ